MNKIIINIDSPSAADDRKTGVFPSRPKWKPGRRRGQPRINFWDLGMVSTGSLYHQWEMLDFQPSIPASFATSTNAFISTYHDELLDKIFEVDVENWRTHYKRIVPEMDYGLTVWAQHNSSFSFIGTEEVLDSSNPNFTNAGLKAQADWLTTDYSPGIGLNNSNRYGAFRAVRFGESIINHITTTYDINASPVSFTPSKKMDVFLVPSLPQMRGRVDYFDSGTHYDQQLNDFWHLYDRGIFLTASHPIYGTEGQAQLNSVYNSGDMADWQALLDYMKGFTGARARYSTDNGATWPSSDDGSNFGAVIPDPYPTFPPNGIADDTSNVLALNASNSTTSPGSSENQIRLRCVIFQGGIYYYVWNIAYT